MKLNLGSGNRLLEGYVNVDREPSLNHNITWDLENFPWPFESNSCEEIMASHVLEHLGQVPSVFNQVIVEIHRILIPEGTLVVKVPHHRSDGYFGDPTHVRAITPQLLSLYSKKHCAECKANNWPNTPLADYLNIDLELRTTNYNMLPRWGAKMQSGTLLEGELAYALDTFNNVADEVTMTLVKIP